MACLEKQKQSYTALSSGLKDFFGKDVRAFELRTQYCTLTSYGGPTASGRISSLAGEMQ